MHALLGEKISRVSHHQQQTISPADQIMLHFESHVIAKIAFIIFRLRRLIYVIVLFYKYAKRWYLYRESYSFKYIYVIHVWKKTKRKTEVHTLKNICKHTYVSVYKSKCIFKV